MKTFKELNEELKPLNESSYQIFYDKSSATWGDQDMISYGLKQGYKLFGVIGTKGAGVRWFTLFNLNDYDKKDVSGVKLKSGEQIFRYASPGTTIGKMLPYIKVNLDRGLVYFLTQDSFDGVIDEPEFETRGQKATFARVLIK